MSAHVLDSCATYLFNLVGQLFIPQRALGRYLPVVGVPPPAPDARTDTLAAELGGAVPVPPACDGQSPEHALSKRHEELFWPSDVSCLWGAGTTHLIPQCNVGDHLPSFGTLYAGEIALLKAKVGQWR